MQKLINRLLVKLFGLRFITNSHYQKLLNNKEKKNLALGIISNYVTNSEDQKKY